MINVSLPQRTEAGSIRRNVTGRHYAQCLMLYANELCVAIALLHTAIRVIVRVFPRSVSSDRPFSALFVVAVIARHDTA